jgi:hypothetical protein
VKNGTFPAEKFVGIILKKAALEIDQIFDHISYLKVVLSTQPPMEI